MAYAGGEQEIVRLPIPIEVAGADQAPATGEGRTVEPTKISIVV